MDKSTLNKLKNIEERFFEIEKLMADQNNASDIQMITKLAKEHSELKKVVNLYQNINEKSSQLIDLKHSIIFLYLQNVNQWLVHQEYIMCFLCPSLRAHLQA